MSNEAHSLLKPADSILPYEPICNDTEIAVQLQTLVAEDIVKVALVTVQLHFEPEGKDANKYVLLEKRIEQGTHYLLDALRPLVRKTDIVYVLHSTCYFLLRGANIEGASIVCNRLWDALLWRVHNITDGEILRPRGMGIGYSAYPEPYEEAGECIVAAYEPKHYFEVQQERRRAGTRQAKVLSEYASSSDASHTPQASHGEHLSTTETDTQEVEHELSTLARKLGIPYLSLLPRKKRAQVQQLVALELAQELHCYPLGRERGMLTVAVSDPQNSSVLDRLHRETGLHIFPVLTQPQELQMALDQLLL